MTVEKSCEAEVGDLSNVSISYQDVRSSEVAMSKCLFLQVAHAFKYLRSIDKAIDLQAMHSEYEEFDDERCR